MLVLLRWRHALQVEVRSIKVVNTPQEVRLLLMISSIQGMLAALIVSGRAAALHWLLIVLLDV